MSLYRVPGDSYQDPIKLRKKKHLASFEKKVNPRSFEKCCQIFDSAIGDLKPSKTSNLVFTRTGFLIGHSSVAPHADVQYLWATVSKHMGNGTPLLRTMGEFMKWRISLREDTWLVYAEETEDIDETTGLVIFVNNFWIDNTYTPPGGGPVNVEDLIAKFGRKSNDRWTIEQLKNSAKKHDTLTSWRIESPDAYQAARRKKILDECCKHMTRSVNDTD